MCARGVEDLPFHNRAAQRVRTGLFSRQKRAEIALLESIDRGGVSKTRQYSGPELQPIEVCEEERLVAPIVDFGDIHGPAGSKPEGIAPLLGDLVGEESAGVQCVVCKVFVQAPVQLFRSRL